MSRDIQQVPKSRVATGLWSIVDQAAASSGTLLLSVLVARATGVVDFGSFSLIFTLYSLILTGARACVSMPYLMVKAARSEVNGLVDAERATLGFAVAVATAAALLVAAASLVTEASISSYLLVLAPVLPLVLLQDAYRFVLLEKQGVRMVAVSDLAWMAVQVMGTTVAIVVPSRLLGFAFLAVWGLSGGVAMVLAAWRLRIVPSLRQGVAFARRYRKRCTTLLVEAGAISGSVQAATFFVGVFGGVGALAPFRGAQVVLGPSSVISSGVLFLVTPIVLRVGGHGGGRLYGVLAWYVGSVCVAALASVAIALTLPEPIGIAVLGESWTRSRELVVPVCAGVCTAAVGTAAMLGFRAYGIVSATMVVRVLAVPGPSAGAIMGFQLAGASGAAYGIALANLLVGVILWLLLRRRRSPLTLAARPRGV